MNSATVLLRSTLVPLVAALAACASGPPADPVLDDARAAYDRASTDPAVARNAPGELRKAQEALRQASDARQRGADRSEVDHYAYLARQRTEIAMAARSIADSDDAVKQAGQRRDAILIESRTRDAETQRRIAEAARMDAEQQRQRADLAQGVAASNAAVARSAQAQAMAARADANALAEQLAELKARPTPRGMVLTLGDVLFDTGRADLNPGASGPIDRLATFLDKNPGRTATIEGYTDSSGGRDMNLSLSERRADAVKNALIGRGIAANRLTARGYGEDQPVATNDTAAGRQQNRRVEIVLSNAG